MRLLQALILIAVFESVATANTSAQNGADLEMQAAVTDRAALDSQRTALQKLSSYLKRSRGTEQESVLLFRMAEIHYQNANIHFRIGHAESSTTKHKANLESSKEALRQTVTTLTELMRKFPSFQDTARALYLRGKSHEELELKTLAKADYIKLIQTFPESTDVSNARMALALYAIEDQQHATAIGYLEPIEKDPTDPHHPYALYKLAWCHYNLAHFAKAQAFLERQIRLYRKGWGGLGADGQLSSSDQALIETSLQDFVLFEVDAIERGDKAFAFHQSAPKFSAIESGVFYGKMLLRYARLLKAKGLKSDLRDWAKAMLPVEYHRPEMFEIATLVFEDEVNRHQYLAASQAAEFFVQITDKNPTVVREFDTYKKAQARLLEVTKTLHTLIKRNRDSDQLHSLTQPLAKLYDVFTRLVEPSDPRVPGAHLNLAETLFEIRQYAKATDHYRWILDHWQSAWAKGAHGLSKSKQDIELRSISARYQHLYEQKLVPEKLALKRVDAETLDEASEPKTDTTTETGIWLQWVDDFVQRYGNRLPEFETFYSESLRMRYFHGHAAYAMAQIRAWTTSGGPLGDPTVAVARLYMDTCIHNETWNHLWTYTQSLLKDPIWPKRITELTDASANAYYKLAQASFEAKQFNDVIDRGKRVQALLPRHPRREDIWHLGIKTGDENAVRTFTDLLTQHFPHSSQTAHGLIARANLLESTYAFDEAANDLSAYSALIQTSFKNKWTETHSKDLQHKILLFRWLDGQSTALYTLTQNKSFCAADPIMCERYEAIALLTQAQTSSGVSSLSRAELRKRTWHMATKADKENRALWAGAALIDQDGLPFPDRLVLARMVANHWSKLEDSSDQAGVNVQLALLPIMIKQIPRVFELNRVSIRQFAKLTGSEKSIERRVQLIQEMENTGTQVAKRFPWARVRSQVLSEIALLYLEFAKALQDVPVPENLPENEKATFQETIRGFVLPFEEKGQNIRRTAFELASKASIEADAFESIAQAFFEDNPSQAQSIKEGVDVGSVSPIHLGMLSTWAPETDWKSTRTPQARWANALKVENWPWVTFYLQEMERKKSLSPVVLDLMRAITLAVSGAQSEAIALLESTRTKLANGPRIHLTLYLLTHAVRTYAKDRARELANDLSTVAQTETLFSYVHSDREAFAIAFAALWAGAKLPDAWITKGLDAARYSSSATAAQWASTQFKSRSIASSPGETKAPTKAKPSRKRK